MFFYKNFTIINILKFEIALISIYFIKLFRTTIRFILTNILQLIYKCNLQQSFFTNRKYKSNI